MISASDGSPACQWVVAITYDTFLTILIVAYRSRNASWLRVSAILPAVRSATAPTSSQPLTWLRHTIFILAAINKGRSIVLSRVFRKRQGLIRPLTDLSAWLRRSNKFPLLFEPRVVLWFYYSSLYLFSLWLAFLFPTVLLLLVCLQLLNQSVYYPSRSSYTIIILKYACHKTLTCGTTVSRKWKDQCASKWKRGSISTNSAAGLSLWKSGRLLSGYSGREAISLYVDIL